MQELLLKTLGRDFDLTRFSSFIKNLFNNIDLSPAPLPLDATFHEHIKSFKFLGEYRDLEKQRLDILIVELKGETKVARAQAFQRNLIARYLKNNLCDAALVAFFTSDSQDWRLSFVKMDYQLTEKGAKVEVGTPPKRFSFLVGATEPSHTACSQLLPLLEDQKVNPSVSKIEDAFSIEKVTKEFFTKYKDLFVILKEELEGNHAFKNEAVKNQLDTSNFAKKLLGQIVFLYFLQKKGWLGVPKNASWGAGDKQFISRLFKECKENNENYFNDYLEELFYNALNNPRNDQADRSYSARFKCRLPFLNGGLFDPDYDWRKSIIYINNDVFEKILDVFDLYNFTVKEDEPLEKEVAVDPEMLGKVFENLLEENLRKGTGTYYTPRDIVHYMCQESLVSYLATQTKAERDAVSHFVKDKNYDESSIPPKLQESTNNLDQALRDIRVIDPACGSGAFCVGMLHEIVKARLQLDPELTEYQAKKEVIQNSIYGVDIDAGAVDIAKLRLWLSLVVDYELEDIEPLPNLDYKIMPGNSLIEMLSPELLQRTSDKDKNKLINELRDLKDEVFSIHDSGLKKKKKAEINSLIQTIIEYERDIAKDSVWREILAKKNQTKMFEDEHEQKSFADDQQVKLRKKIEELDNLKKFTDSDHFEWHLNFNEVYEKGGFDVVIANPPYVSTKSVDKSNKPILKKYFGFSDDLYSHFFFKAFELLKKGGTISFITSSTFLTISTKANLRKLLQKKTMLELIKIDYVFEAMVSPAITLAQNTESDDDYSFKFKDAVSDFERPIVYDTRIGIFRNAVNSVFFPPSFFNMAIYKKYNQKLNTLYEEWWERIETSKKIQQNLELLTNYRKTLQYGEIGLLGTLTEGGVGLQTGDNGRFVGVRSNTKQAKNIVITRPKKLFEAVKAKKIPMPISSKGDAADFLAKKSEEEITQLFDQLKVKYGNDIFGQGYLFRIIPDRQIADPVELDEEEKKNGIAEKMPHYVPYDKGDKYGNRWYLSTPFLLDWSKGAVQWFSKNSGKTAKGMPVVRNPQFYFREGFCWSDINTTYLKCRSKNNGIHDVKSMSLFGLTEKVPEYYIICLINSKFISEYVDDFVNNTQTFQINDARQLPIIIPTKSQLAGFKEIFDQAVNIKRAQFANSLGKEEAETELEKVQNRLDEAVYELYDLTEARLPVGETS